MQKHCASCGQDFALHYDWRHHGCETFGPRRDYNRMEGALMAPLRAFAEFADVLTKEMIAALGPYAQAAARFGDILAGVHFGR